jgi:hypothetical protein
MEFLLYVQDNLTIDKCCEIFDTPNEIYRGYSLGIHLWEKYSTCDSSIGNEPFDALKFYTWNLDNTNKQKLIIWWGCPFTQRIDTELTILAYIHSNFSGMVALQLWKVEGDAVWNQFIADGRNVVTFYNNLHILKKHLLFSWAKIAAADALFN